MSRIWLKTNLDNVTFCQIVGLYFSLQTIGRPEKIVYLAFGDPANSQTKIRFGPTLPNTIFFPRRPVNKKNKFFPALFRLDSHVWVRFGDEGVRVKG